MRKLTTHSDLDALVDYIHNNRGELTPALQKKLDRMAECADLIRQHLSKLVVAPKLMVRFDVSRAEAYRIFDETAEIFAPPATASHRTLYVDIILAKMALTHEKALAKEDFKSAAAVLGQMVAAVEKFFGDHEAIDWKKVQPPRFLFLFDPKLLGANQLPQEQLDTFAAKMLQAKRRKNLADLGGIQDAELVEEAPQ